MTTHQSLAEAARKGVFRSLPDSVLDAESEIRLHGCSVGKDVRILQILSRILGGGDPQRPIVRASLWYTGFRLGQPGTSGSTRYICESWDLCFRPGERPSDRVLASRFRAQFPRTGLDIEGALGHRSTRLADNAFSYETPIRFCWTMVYPGASPPSPPSGPWIRHWLRSCDTFWTHLQSSGLAFDQMHWEVLPTRRVVDGVEYPALEILGLGRAVHVLRILEAKDGKGPAPHLAWDDKRYYASAR